MALVISSASLGNYRAYIVHRAPGGIGSFNYLVFDDDSNVISTVLVRTSTEAPNQVAPIDLHTIGNGVVDIQPSGFLLISASDVTVDGKGYYVFSEDDNAGGDPTTPMSYDSRILKPGSLFVVETLGSGNFQLTAQLFDSARHPTTTLQSEVSVSNSDAPLPPKLVNVAIDQISPHQATVNRTQMLKISVNPFASVLLEEQVNPIGRRLIRRRTSSE
jgi:hypothetical protein